MTNKILTKETGATFTPPDLALFLAKKILENLDVSSGESPLSILDPACGDGQLLCSIHDVLKNAGIDNFQLTGYDFNREFLEEARHNFLENDISNFFLEEEDFLDQFDSGDIAQNSLFNKLSDTYDVVIANPPYVRTQILGAEKAQRIAKKFNLKGRVDLYYPFLIAMTKSLKTEGLIGVITSNKFLFTKSGESIRNFLVEHYEIIDVIDLGDTKLFDAAVLPAILIGRKKPRAAGKSAALNQASAKFSKIYEELNGYDGPFITANSVYEILESGEQGYFKSRSKKYKKSTGVLRFSDVKGSFWAMLTKDEHDWIKRVENNSASAIGNHFKVRVGIKTTADPVFIKSDWQLLPPDITPEKEILKTLISQENIDKWQLTQSKNLKVLYPYFALNKKRSLVDINNFPKTHAYLYSHEESLKSRKYVTKSGRKWYEIWVPQNPYLWPFPKLVFPDISSFPRFYYDEEGKIVNGNCYWIVATKAKEKDLLFLIQGVSNSTFMTKYHDLVFNNKLYSGKRRYFTQYVENYPLPDLNSLPVKQIISIVKKLNFEELRKSEIIELEKELEVKVAEAFNLPPVFDLH